MMASMRAEYPGSKAWAEGHCYDFEDKIASVEMGDIMTVAEFEALVKEARKFVEGQLGEVADGA